MSESKNTRRQFLFSGISAALGFLFLKFAGAKKLYADEIQVVIDIAEYPELKEDGGSKTVKDIIIGDMTDNLLIVRKSEKEYLVLSAVCRHKKCNVKYKKDKTQFVCPCHGSTYDIAGKVQKGPSQSDLELYKATLDGTKLTVTKA